jgi:DGQHR domain-containing protein
MAKNSIGPFKVQEINQKDGSFYSACIPARSLTAITYSDVRRLVDEERDVERYLGVQRPINKARVKKIRDYILSPDPTFPTAIIIAVNEDCVEFDFENSEMTLHASQADKTTNDRGQISFAKIAKVLDGQHRLAGFFNENGEYDIGGSEFDLNVAIFVGADISVQAQIFATVNLAQTKVSKSLVYELEDLSETRSPFKTGHNIAVALDNLEDSPFFKRIKRLGFVTPGRTGETITQAAFVEALTDLISKDPFADRNLLLDGKKPTRASESDLLRTPFRNMFLDKRDFDIADNVDNYFRAVRRKWPSAWADTSRKSGILPKTNAFRAFMRHLRDIYPEISRRYNDGIVPVETYLEVLARVQLADEELTSRNFKPGSSGQAAFYKVLTGQSAPEELFEQLAFPLDD